MDSKLNESLYRKKLIKSKSGLRMVLVNEKYSSPFLLCEPYWVPDHEITHCTSCKGKFNFTKRKHHCRRCGRIYCSSCTCSRIPLPRMSFVDPVRVCDKCAHVTKQESDFFNKSIKTLTNGATFLLSPLKESGTTCLCLCKLSSDHKHLEFDTAASLPPLPLDSVTNFNIAHDTDDLMKVQEEILAKKGRPVKGEEMQMLNIILQIMCPQQSVIGLLVSFKAVTQKRCWGAESVALSGGSSIEISYENGGFRLTTGPETTRLQALEWIEAMDEAFRLINVSPTEQ